MADRGNCGDCAFVHRTKLGQMECRRFPPVLSKMEVPGVSRRRVWPTVSEKDWCGEWRGSVSGG